MTTTTNPIEIWEGVLTGIGMEKGFVSSTLIQALQENSLGADRLAYDSFGGIIEAQSADEAAIRFTQETAKIYLLQEFLLPAIDWKRAWEELSATEGYLVLPTHLPTYWAIIRPDDFHKLPESSN